jgi:predicted glycosyltransferase
MNRRPPLLFYCQHSVGLGHLTRSYALCAHLAEWFRVVLVCGGSLPEEIDPPPGVEIVALPPLGVGAASRFVSHDPRFTVERAWAVRGELLLRTLRTLRPAVVFVELFPFGRAKFARELVPLLELAREDGAMTACSLRDILVTGRDDQARHDDRACRLANAHLDAVLVHSDPRFARLDETFGAADRLTVPIRYTGFVVGRTRSRPRERRVVVSAGGGLVGEPLLRAAIEAQRIGTGLPMRAIAGPLMPDDAFARLRAEAEGVPELELLRSAPDLGVELASATAAVSQAGYNTTLEIVRAGVPALVVPYATPEEDEQLRRARRFAGLGALRVLEPPGVCPPGTYPQGDRPPGDPPDAETLADEIRRLEAFTPTSPAIDLDGGHGTCHELWNLMRSDPRPALLATVASP